MCWKNEKVTRALNDERIDKIISLVKLTDDAINNLAYLDPDSKIWIKLTLGPIGSKEPFIHYVHFSEETIPIGNDWNPLPWMTLTNSELTLTILVGFHLCHPCHHLI
jgi:hypothetical protein